LKEVAVWKELESGGRSWRVVCLENRLLGFSVLSLGHPLVLAGL
jgi:hypothetical protein